MFVLRYGLTPINIALRSIYLFDTFIHALFIPNYNVHELRNE